ncbi:ogr/Delta-like zinc finger family protein [Novosphingobium sp. 9]|uniref:ogr/Delta-like zinc finger family protein n=1 Tax=Novosphingobium sp. 9 TaxID=2025349 RepID=UPI0021B5C7BA|nr:ogr/Delta-like zinc finger family protein [Novosphingobium sp. 9]
MAFRLRSGGSQSGRDAAFVLCPKCEAPAFIRRSERITPKVKHLHAHCTNTGCGHTYMVEVSFVHSFNPGLIDRPDLDLPVCPVDQVPHVLPPSRGAEPDDDQMSMFVT